MLRKAASTPTAIGRASFVLPIILMVMISAKVMLDEWIVPRFVHPIRRMIKGGRSSAGCVRKEVGVKVGVQYADIRYIFAMRADSVALAETETGAQAKIPGSGPVN